MLLASRGIDRDNNFVTNTYVVNENFDVYYIISGTIGEKESEEVDWKYAWTSDGETWSDTYYGDSLPEGTKLEGKVVAKIYETDETIQSFTVDGFDEPVVLPAGKGYVLDIQGEGDMPGMIFATEEDFGYCAWYKETLRLGTRDGDLVEELVENPIILYITKVIIGEGITNVPDTMIAYWGYNLKEIEISNTVTIIGENAFSDCQKLNKVKLGNNIKTIGNSAFVGCISLESIVIPASVERIERHGFEECESLKAIYMETTGSVEEYDIEAFYNLSENAVMYVRNENIANKFKGNFNVSSDYNWVAPTE